MNHTWREVWRSRWDTFKPILPFALRAVMIGGPVGAIAYWVFWPRGLYVRRADLCLGLAILAWAGVEWLRYRQAQPPKMDFVLDESVGYWRCRQDLFDPRICFATRREEDKIPKPHREFGIQVVGKIHCVVDGEFWVWQES
jgi:hypothetical protein